jgi:putative hydrolase of the HAD superfamily
MMFLMSHYSYEVLIDCNIQIGRSQRVEGADYALESIHNLTEAVPDLWESDIKSEAVYTGNLAVETTVTA